MVDVLGREEGNVTKKEKGDKVVVAVVWRVESGRLVAGAAFVVVVVGVVDDLGGEVVVLSLNVGLGDVVAVVVFVTGLRLVVRILDMVTSLSLMKLLFCSNHFSKFLVYRPVGSYRSAKAIYLSGY